MSGVSVSHPERWGIPFSDQMTDEEVDRLLSLSLFTKKSIDPAKFSQKIPLGGILKNDARLLRCQPGEIIVRKGDWGNSAFFLLSGSVRVEIERGRELPAEMLGRATVRRKSIWEALQQLWNGSPIPEVRDLESYQRDSAANRGEGAETRVFLQDFSQVISRYKTTQIKAVEIFGEQSALGRIERTATVFADDDCELLEMRWQGLRDIMRVAPWLRERIDERFRAYGLRAFLRNSPYFEHLKVDEDTAEDEKEHVESLAKMVRKEAEFASYGSYDKVDRFTKLIESGSASDLEHEPLIAHEGDYPYGVILIRSGIARVSHRHHNGHKTISYLMPGQAFGVDEIVEGWQTGKPSHLKHSLRAVGYVTVVRIPTAVFETVVLNERRAGGDAGPAILPTTAVPQEGASKTLEPGLMEFLVERRFVNGTATMVIDLDRCTRCDDCVRACATAHDNNPRFLRNGPVHGRYMVANACMHCADPVCMVQCPTGAIHRNVLAGQVVINDSTCVGCGACASNCPYEAIRMVQIRDQNGNPVFPSHRVRSGEDGADELSPILPIMKEWEPIEKATKCDLCADQLTGPACQNACPHDALVRLDLGSYETATDWLMR